MQGTAASVLTVMRLARDGLPLNVAHPIREEVEYRPAWTTTGTIDKIVADFCAFGFRYPMAASLLELCYQIARVAHIMVVSVNLLHTHRN